MTQERNSSQKLRPKVAFIGALPPPYMGPTLATEVILNSSLSEDFQLVHVDTSDHRDLSTLGAVDLNNVIGALVSYWRLVCCICVHRPKIVYIPISQTTLGYLKDSGYILISRLFFRRVVCHLRGGNFKNWLAGATTLTRSYVKSVHKLSHRQIVLGECLRPLFEDIMITSRIDVVPNGKDIEVELYQTKKRSDTDEKICVLFLANMMRTKGVIDLLHSLPLVLDEYSNVEYCFAGDWNHADVKAEVDSYVNEHPGLPLRFLGKVGAEDKYRVLSESDMFVFPTYYPPEGHPWVIIEAMAFGLPVISTDQGAIRETVIHGENGYIVEKRNPRVIADRIVELCSDSELRLMMGRRSSQFYASKYTESQMIKRLGESLTRALT